MSGHTDVSVVRNSKKKRMCKHFPVLVKKYSHLKKVWLISSEKSSTVPNWRKKNTDNISFENSQHAQLW